MMFLEKLDMLMNQKGINKRKLSALSDVPYTTIDAFYKKGYENAKISTIRKIAKALDVSLDFLIEDRPASAVTSAASPAVKTVDFGADYDKLTPKHKESVDYFIKALLAKQREEEKPVEDVRFIDLFDMPVSAGNGVYLEGYDTHPIEIVNTPEAARADYALRVSGDSMEPMFSDGDIVLVETMPQIPQKAIGVFIHDGEGYIKQLDGPYMRSLNPAYEPILANSDTIIKGRVLGKAELV